MPTVVQHKENRKKLWELWWLTSAGMVLAGDVSMLAISSPAAVAHQLALREDTFVWKGIH